MDLERELRIAEEYLYLLSSLRGAKRHYGTLERNAAMEQLNKAFESRVALLSDSLSILTEARIRATESIENHFKKMDATNINPTNQISFEANRIYEGIIRQIDIKGYRGNEAYRHYQTLQHELMTDCTGPASGTILTIAFNRVIAELRRRDEEDEKD